MKRAVLPWFRPPGLMLVTIPLALITVLHYATPAHHHAHIFHDVYRRLYYVPVVAAALLWGTRVGLAAAGITVAVYLPHVIHCWDRIPSQTTEALFEMVMYCGVAALTGSLSESLHRQRDALVQSDRLRSLGTLAAGMAHEVRNPLAAIKGAASRLRKGDPGEPTRTELLGIVEKESDRLDGLVREFLGYARPPKLVRTMCDLNAVAAEAVALADHAASPRSVGLKLEPAPAAGPVSADPARVKQALLNILLNAVEASPPGSQVSVEVRLRRRAVSVAVRDSGPGVPEEVRRNLFEPFVTSKQGGTGLGLAIARQVIEAHGGTISLGDAEGGGTEAVLELPAGTP